jgi:hypothetical protein
VKCRLAMKLKHGSISSLTLTRSIVFIPSRES